MKQKKKKAVFKLENDTKIQYYKIGIQLVKVEKLIYKSLGKSRIGVIFQKLFQKYSDLMAESYEISENMVQLGSKEQTHIEYCSSSLKQRDYIEQLCSLGSKR